MVLFLGLRMLLLFRSASQTCYPHVPVQFSARLASKTGQLVSPSPVLVLGGADGGVDAVQHVLGHAERAPQLRHVLLALGLLAARLLRHRLQDALQEELVLR